MTLKFLIWFDHWCCKFHVSDHLFEPTFFLKLRWLIWCIVQEIYYLLIFRYYIIILILGHQQFYFFLLDIYIYIFWYSLLCSFITVSELFCCEVFETFITLSIILFPKELFLDSDSFYNCIHVSLVNVQTNYCNDNLSIFDVKQLNKIMKLYNFYNLKALWDGQGKIKMYYGMSSLKKQLSGKRSIKLVVAFSSLFLIKLVLSATVADYSA